MAKKLFTLFWMFLLFVGLNPITTMALEPKDESVINISLPKTSTILNLEKVKEINKKITLEIETKEEQEKTKYQFLGTFLLTGYDDCYQCQEEYVGTTALGVAPRTNHTIAVDTRVIPLGSHVLINDIEYVAEDVGGGVSGSHIDIFVGSHAETFSNFCNGYADVYLIVD